MEQHEPSTGKKPSDRSVKTHAEVHMVVDSDAADDTIDVQVTRETADEEPADLVSSALEMVAKISLQRSTSTVAANRVEQEAEHLLQIEGESYHMMESVIRRRLQDLDDCSRDSLEVGDVIMSM